MRRRRIAALVLIFTASASGCGGNGSPDQPSTQVPPRSPYDSGPRAADSPVVGVLTARGESVFKSKGCTACHAFGKRLTGPDLQGVTRRRTAAWLEQQILHPEVMLQRDPITRAMFDEYRLQMANQGLTPDEARAVIEFLKERDAASGPPPPAGAAAASPQTPP